jgi:23S rRNA (uracil1939-C5)-methyltransferase
VKKNDVLELKIVDMGVAGEGIGKADGITLFVKDAIIGDRILVKILKMKKNYGYARLMEVLEPSPHRVDPVCPIHRQCGGCQLQVMEYKKQLDFKVNKVLNNLKRIGGIEVQKPNQLLGGECFVINSEEKNKVIMEPPVGMADPYRYRNKAQFPIGKDKEGNVVVGLYASRSHNIIPCKTCYLVKELNEDILTAIIDYMEEFKVEPYDEKTGTGLVRHALIRTGFSSGESLVCIVVNGRSLPKMERLVSSLKRISGVVGLVLNVNTENTNVILGEEVICVWGKEYIMDSIGSLNFKISALSFYQVNPIQTIKLYNKVMEYADLTGNEIVWDLYCGIGTISLFLASKAKMVYGVEVIPQAIKDAFENAERNGVLNADFFVGKVEDVLPEFYQGDDRDGVQRPDIVVVDPPRKGCDVKCLTTILLVAPKKVIYVSCDPATLARDLKLLCSGGYEVREVCVIDMFGETCHVETVVSLSLKKDIPKIEVTMELDENSNYKPEEKATYPKIKEYVKEKYGVNVHSCYIAEVKRMCGLDMGENYNKSKKDELDVKHCPQEKVEYIKEALKYYGVV